MSSLEKANVALQKGEKLDPTVAEFHIGKAESKLLAARWRPTAELFQQAFNSLNQAIKLNPKNADAQLMRAQYYRWHIDWLQSERGSVASELEQGIQACNEAIQLNPDLAEAYAVRGILYAKQGKLELSKKEMSEAFRINKHLKSEYSKYL